MGVTSKHRQKLRNCPNSRYSRIVKFGSYKWWVQFNEQHICLASTNVTNFNCIVWWSQCPMCGCVVGKKQVISILWATRLTFPRSIVSAQWCCFNFNSDTIAIGILKANLWLLDQKVLSCLVNKDYFQRILKKMYSGTVNLIEVQNTQLSTIQALICSKSQISGYNYIKIELLYYFFFTILYYITCKGHVSFQVRRFPHE